MTPPNVSRLKQELRRLLEGAGLANKPQGLGTVRFKVVCRGDSETVLQNAKEVLTALVRKAISEWPWPDDHKWRNALPQWFVERCGEELTAEEAEKWLEWWRGLPWEKQQQVEKEKPWSLSDWIYWFHPNQRTWYWWDAQCTSAYVCWVATEVDEWPFPWGALDWLFRAAGAVSVKAEDQ
jgi:hypothetical protein